MKSGETGIQPQLSSEFRLSEQLGRLYPKGGRYPQNVDEGDVLLPSLDLTDVSPMESTGLGKVLLAQFEQTPKLANGVAELTELGFAL